MFAMMITAVSYGRMAALFPSAGSAYTYVGKGINPHLGFLAGWAMFLDYLLLPLINCVWIAAAMHNVYTPKVPFAVWAAIVAGIITLLNLQGVRSSARQNQILLFGMFIVIGFFIVLGDAIFVSRPGMGRNFLDAAVLRSGDVQHAAGFGSDFVCGAYLHRFRRRDHADRRRRESEAEYFAGDRDRLRVHGTVRRARGLSRPARLARLALLQVARDRVHGCLRTRWRSGVCSTRWASC